ncbi:MAG: hypothetical protein HQM03_00655 [Magnetococcales bacterium]|nr:hypothetical protein [Magnetococcales bacterium]
MACSFGVVENKLYEAEFFLEKIQACNKNDFEVRYYFSAFVSASRSVTFALQASMKGIDGFDTWYSIAREKLNLDPLARYFVEIRNIVVHKGENPYNEVPLEYLKLYLAAQILHHDQSDVLLVPNMGDNNGCELINAKQACINYFKSIILIIFDCYDKFKYIVDPKWYFTESNFNRNGKSLDDALDELGFPRDWISHITPEKEAWKILRSREQSCIINPIFYKYLDVVIDDPDDSEMENY